MYNIVKQEIILPQLIREYTALHKPIRDFELDGYVRELPRYGNAVYVRGLRVRDLDGRKITSIKQIEKGMKVILNNEHQYRTRLETKDRLIRMLDFACLHITPSMTFEELYAEVERVLGPMTDLLHYDITLRIGAANGIRPNNYVYLHAGAFKGANALKPYYPQLKIEAPCVKLSEFVDVVTELQGFSAYDMEHFLCINHTRF